MIANAGFGGNSQAFWDDWLAKTWDEPRRMWPTKNALIASLTPKSDVVLDIACGSGGILRHLQRLGYSELHGLEHSPYAVKRLAQDGIKMHWGKLPAIALPDESVDTIIASQVLEHVIRRSRFVSEMRRVMRPGARALIFVPDNCLGPIDEPNHVIKYNRKTLRDFLGRYFDIVAIESFRDANHNMPVLFAHVRKHPPNDQSKRTAL